MALAGTLLSLALMSKAQVAHSGPGLGQTGAASDPSVELGPAAAPRAGETCMVCKKPVGPADRVYSVDGQRAPVHTANCDALLKHDPGRYLDSLRPRGAFLGAEPSRGFAVSWVWVIAASYVLLGLVCGGLCSYRALDRGFDPLRWFFAGFFLNVVAAAFLLTRRAETAASRHGGVPRGLAKVPATYAPQSCHGCGKLNHPAAGSCAGCGRKLEPQVASEVGKTGLRRADSSGRGRV